MTVRTRCPVCDQKWTPPDLFVDLNTNTVFANGAGVQAEPQTAKIIAHIIQQMPIPVTTEELMSVLWAGKAWPDDPQHRVHVCIQKLRRMLKPRRFEIIAKGHGGYVIRRVRTIGDIPLALFTVGVAKSVK